MSKRFCRVAPPRPSRLRRAVGRSSAAASVLAVLALAGCTPAARKQDPRMSDAERAFNEGIDAPPTSKSLHAAARVMAAQGRDAECEFLITRTIHENPGYLPAYADLAELRMRQRQIDEAIRTLRRGLELAPRDAVLLNNLAICMMIKGDYEGALQAAAEAVAVAPHNARYRGNLATILGLMGRREESLSIYEQILPEEDAYHNIAVLHRARNQLLRGARR